MVHAVIHFDKEEFTWITHIANIPGSTARVVFYSYLFWKTTARAINLVSFFHGIPFLKCDVPNSDIVSESLACRCCGLAEACLRASCEAKGQLDGGFNCDFQSLDGDIYAITSAGACSGPKHALLYMGPVEYYIQTSPRWRRTEIGLCSIKMGFS